MSGRAIEPLCAAVLLAACLLGGSAAAGRTLPAVPELLSLPLLAVTAAQAGRSADQAASARTRWWIAAVVLGLPAIQLVPLPAQVWSVLPGRASVAEGYAAAGLALPWLPLSLTPGATERIWLGLLPAVSLFLAVPLLAVAARRRLMHFAVLIGVLDVLLGFAQIAGGPDSPLRLYASASRTDAVGLFANRNHHATFLMLLILLAGALLADRRRSALAERVWLSAAGVLLLLGVAASGSRAGMALGTGAGLAVAWMLLAGRADRGSGKAAAGAASAIRSAGKANRERLSTRWMPLRRRAARRTETSEAPPTAAPSSAGRTTGRRRALIVWGGLVAAALAIGLALYGSAALRLQADAVTADLRWQIARTTWRAVADMFPVGGGLGSFERLYARTEQPDELGPAIVNNAHDDWLELVLEGGLPALLLLLAGLGFLVRASLKPGAQADAGLRSMRNAALAALWLCALHETVDYPLRTMAVNVLLALACGLWAAPAVAASSDRGGASNRRFRDSAARPVRA